MKKLLFFDIDGTLAHPGQAPGRDTADAIRRARRNGHMAFLSTGRTADSIPEPVRAIGFDGGIFSAGGLVVLEDRVIASFRMDPGRLERIRSLLERMPVLYALETPEGRFSGGDPHRILELADLTGTGPELRKLTREILFDPGFRPMEQYSGQPVFKIAYHCPGRAEAAALAAGLEGIAHVVPFDNIPGLPIAIGEISDPMIHKGNALKAVCAHLGRTAEDCIAFGDSMNDAQILSAAGVGIAMGNADPRLKAMADLVCDRCENDGIAKALAELGLI